MRRYLTMAMMAFQSLFPLSVFGLAVGQQAPDFAAQSTRGPIQLKEYAGKRAVVLAVHGAHDPETDVTHDDPILTGKIAWAPLKELPDYYTRLAVMEAEAES